MAHPSTRDRSLEMDAPFAIGESSVRWIVDLARQIDARRILEFGSGRSTARLAMELPNVEITSVEHEPVYADQTEQILTELGVAGRVTLIRSRVGWWRHAGRIFYTYVAPVPQAAYDLVLIDGPPGYLHTGRQGALHKVFEMLPIGARVVLDDFNEPREQRALRRWLRDYRDAFTWRAIDVGHKLLLLEKTANRPISPATIAILTNNILDNGRSIVRRCSHNAVRLVRALVTARPTPPGTFR